MGGMFCWWCKKISLSLLRCNKTLLQTVLEDPAAMLSRSAGGRQRTLWVGRFFPFLTGACLMCSEPSPGCRDPGACWDVGGHPSHVPGSTTPLGPDAHRARGFPTVSERRAAQSLSRAPNSPIPGNHLGMLRRWEWAGGPKISSWWLDILGISGPWMCH